MNGCRLVMLMVLATISALAQPQPVPEEKPTHLSEKRLADPITAGLIMGGATMIAGIVSAVITRYGRHKRAVEPEAASPEDYLREAILMDDQDCGRRFVCELEAAAEDELSMQELLVRSTFRKPSEGTSGMAGKFYIDAGHVGATGGEEACLRKFSSCPYDRKILFQQYQQQQQKQ